MSTHIEAAVARLLGARKGGAAVPPDFVAAHPLSSSDARTVREKVQAAFGPVAAWKVAPGSTLENPLYAPVFVKDIHATPVRFPRGTFRKIGMECEIAYRLGRDLLKPPYTRDQVADAIDSLLPLIEICDSRLVDNKVASAAWRFADHNGNGAVVLGTPVKDWKSVNLQQLKVTFTFKGKTVAEKSGVPKANLVDVVHLLANQAGTHCGGLRAGHIVTTGSICGNLPTLPGTEVVASYPGLGDLKVTFDE